MVVDPPLSRIDLVFYMPLARVLNVVFYAGLLYNVNCYGGCLNASHCNEVVARFYGPIPYYNNDSFVTTGHYDYKRAGIVEKLTKIRLVSFQSGSGKHFMTVCWYILHDFESRCIWILSTISKPEPSINSRQGEIPSYSYLIVICLALPEPASSLANL